MRFKPVHLPADRRLNGRASQTMLRHYDRCPRSGYLYALYKGEAQTIEMVRGSALHAVVERGTRHAMGEGMQQAEGYVPGDVVKVIVDEVLAEYHVPLSEHDYIREMAYRWAGEFACKPAEVIACETLIVLQIDGWDVRMKVDFAEILERGGACHVVDYKSSRSMPTQEDVARKRPSALDASEAGALLAKNFQLVLYALGLAFGTPVRIVDGEEVPEPFPLAGQAQRFDLEFVFPGIENKTDGMMGRRPMSLTRTELSEYMESLRALLKRLGNSEESGDWPAQVSDDACTECPARTLCPIPAELRDHRGTINTIEQAAEAQEKLDRVRAESDAISREIKAFCKAHNVDLRFGKDKVREWTVTETEKLTDREGFILAAERAAEFGEPFERSRFIKTARGTGFSVRTLTADELAAEAAERSAT